MVDLEIKKVTKENKNYPKSLVDLDDPPETLYYIGDLGSIEWDKCLAVVGSRQMTHYGRSVPDKFIPDFVMAGVTIVSGFMYGVDTQAHKVTIENGGKTIAVLASGIDICYPIENKKLYQSIIKGGGLIISEYPKGRKPHLWTFPRRNRIVAAISQLGTLVVEAGENSGSLLTATIARKLKRKVYAVPGAVTSKVSMGTNFLLQNRKAKLTMNSEDIVSIEHQRLPSSGLLNLDPLEANIYQTLLRENCTLDELCLIINKDITTVSSQVSLMAWKGLIEEIGGKLFAKEL